MDWKPNKTKRRRRWPQQTPKNTALRRKYGVQWWKADPTVRKIGS